MKKILIPAVVACLILVAGCTTVAPAGTNSQSTGLTMNEPAVLASDKYSFNASVSEISVSEAKSGGRMVDIYINVKNTGTTPVRLNWFSTITDTAGISHGGVNVSHGGSGAHSTLLLPGRSEVSRDYVIVVSDKHYAALSRGATLDVAFTAQNETGETSVPFHATWTLDPKYFR